MEVVELTVLCKVSRKMQLGLHAGSIFRGILGAELKRMVCRRPRSTCDRCGAAKCLYRDWFDSSGTVKPFAVEPVDAPARLKPGQTVEFRLRLFGDATRFWPIVMGALQQAPTTPDRRGRKIYITAVREGERILTPGSAAPRRRQIAPLVGNRWRMRIETPMRIVRNGLLVRPESFQAEDLMRAIRSRLASTGAPVPTSDALTVEAADLAWQEHYRYSARRRRYMPASGLVGEVVIETDDPAWKEALAIAAVTGIGRFSTGGNGVIHLRAVR